MFLFPLGETRCNELAATTQTLEITLEMFSYAASRKAVHKTRTPGTFFASLVLLRTESRTHLLVVPTTGPNLSAFSVLICSRFARDNRTRMTGVFFK